MEGSVSSSASTFNIHRYFVDQPAEAEPVSASVSAANSSPSSALPSPPDSPSSDSVSSFPSVSSSFFFSSQAASPPHSQPHSGHLRELTEGLIIPALTLPSALRRPTPYGQTIGDLRILVLGNQGAGKTFLTTLLLEDNRAVVEVGNWEDAEYGKVLYASTDWIEHKDAHGLEKYEPTRNIEIIELPGYNQTCDVRLVNYLILQLVPDRLSCYRDPNLSTRFNPLSTLHFMPCLKLSILTTRHRHSLLVYFRRPLRLCSPL